MHNNVCKFVPNPQSYKDLYTIHFVHEKNYPSSGTLNRLIYYSANLVTCGEGTLTMYSKTFPLRKGCIFFLFPSTPYKVESIDGLQCIYVSFLGTRANKIMDDLNITKASPLFYGYEQCLPFFEQAIEISTADNLALISESVLLYTFSLLTIARKRGQTDQAHTPWIYMVKKYLDENYTDCELSLSTISAQFSYSTKYISSAFQKEYHVSFKGYLANLRIQKACNLISRGYTSVKTIALMCGFGDPFYFSKVFKTKTGMSPKEYIHSVWQEP